MDEKKGAVRVACRVKEEDRRVVAGRVRPVLPRADE